MARPLVAIPTKIDQALAWLHHLNFAATALDAEMSHAAKRTFLSALHQDGLIPERFVFRSESARAGHYLWEYLVDHETSQERAGACFSPGTELLAFFDFTPLVFVCHATGAFPVVPKLDLSFLNLATHEVISFGHEERGPALYRISPPNRPHTLRALRTGTLPPLP